MGMRTKTKKIIRLGGPINPHTKWSAILSININLLPLGKRIKTFSIRIKDSFGVGVKKVRTSATESMADVQIFLEDPPRRIFEFHIQCRIESRGR